MLKQKVSQMVKLLIAAAMTLPSTMVIAQAAEEITYTEHVATIMQEKCQVCHQPDSVAPMSLLTYEDAQIFAPLIKLKVEQRLMPPWHVNPYVGIQEFKNDRSLSDEQIETIVKWVDGGAPLGPIEAMPPAKVFPDPNRWQLADRFGEPDLIVKSTPYTMAAVTQDKWWQPIVDTGLTEARWVRAIEIKPSYPNGRKIVHHALAILLQDEDGVTNLASTITDARTANGTSGFGPNAGLFMEWAVGKVGEIFPEGAGKLMLPGAKIVWDLHLHAAGIEVVDDVTELGIYFYPKGYVPRNRTVLRGLSALGNQGIDVRPHETAMTQQFHYIEAPVRLENFQPHLHMVGKAMSLEVQYPDGSREVLNHVDNFQWNWHNNYVYADDAAPLIPAGSTLIVTAWYDNTVNNPQAPDPRQWVGYGDRTVDEMGHLWVDFTYLEQEEFDSLLLAREERKAAEDSN